MQFDDFRQRATAWQRQFRLQQSGNIFQRILLWLMLGVMLFVGVFVLLFMLLLSWLLIPILLYRYRKNMQQFRQYQQSQSAQQPGPQDVIEGEVINKKEE